MNQRLHKAREDRRLSIEKAAEKIGVSRTTFIRWEKGTQQPHGSTLDLVCEAFNMTPEQLGFQEFSRLPAVVGIKATQSSRVSPPSTSTSPVDMFRVATIALVLAQQQYGWSLEELRFYTEQELVRLDIMTQQQPGKNLPRRDALSFLVTLPAAMLGWPATGGSTSFSPEEVLPLFVTSIPACWRLYYSGPGEWREVSQVLPTYISQLTPFAQQTSKQQKMAASLLSQAHQLGAEITLTGEDFHASIAHCKQASLYAELAEDTNLQAASLIREANTLFYRKRSTVQINQQAMRYLQSISPLLQGRIYSELSTSAAELDQEQEALRYIGLAHEITPAQPEDDPGFAYTHSDQYIVYFNDTYVHLQFGRPKKAWDAINQASAFVADAITPRRMELLKQFVTVAIALGDLDLCLEQYKKLASAASSLESDLHFSETFNVHREMLTKWPHEKRVKLLAEIHQK